MIPRLFSTDGSVWIGDGGDPEAVADLIFQRWQGSSGGGTGTGGGLPPTPPSPPPPAQVVPAVAPPSGGPAPAALSIWRDKLTFLLAEEPKLTDPEQKFAIAQRIAECRGKIRELGGGD